MWHTAVVPTPFVLRYQSRYVVFQYFVCVFFSQPGRFLAPCCDRALGFKKASFSYCEMIIIATIIIVIVVVVDIIICHQHRRRRHHQHLHHHHHHNHDHHHHHNHRHHRHRHRHVWFCYSVMSPSGQCRRLMAVLKRLRGCSCGDVLDECCQSDYCFRDCVSFREGFYLKSSSRHGIKLCALQIEWPHQKTK